MPTGLHINILFLCIGNSCRSILAEATFNALAPEGFRAYSAGSRPTGFVHPRSLALLRRLGIPAEGYFSKSWHALPVAPDIVITVCGNAATDSCPTHFEQAIRAHWGVEDPAEVTGTEAEIETAFDSAYHLLRKRIEALLGLPLIELMKDRGQLQRTLAQIGQIQ